MAFKYTGVCDKCGGTAVGRVGTGYSSTLVEYGSCKTDPSKQHDGNCQGAMFRCANGHDFLIYRLRRCGDEEGGSACEWTGRKECSTCSAVHVDWPEVPVVERRVGL